MTRLVHIMTLPQTAASFLQGQLRWMRLRGYEITVITSPGAQLAQFARSEGVQWRSVPMRRAISPGSDVWAVREMARHLQELQPHIVHAHTPKAGLVGMLAASVCRIPVKLYHLHGLRGETSRGWRRVLLEGAERATCALADHVLCVSPSLRDAVLRRRLIPAQRISVPADGSINGLELSEFNPVTLRDRYRIATRRRLGIPLEARCLGFVGRLVRDKGVIELHQAWQRLREHFPDLHLVVVGPFEPEDPVPADVRRQFVDDPRVHCVGLDWNVKPYYAAMDVFTLPTHREGLGNVLLEAAAMELPIVSCRVTGCVDAVLEGNTARLVPPGQAIPLAEAIASYLHDPGCARAHGRAGRQYVGQRFAPVRVWTALDQYYRMALESGSDRSTITERTRVA
jgi:glycosyltransferase involved in cell wall biosynthesis